ncbi:MAG: Serine hydrolase [Actinomycetia bacterium]|nr:Serine hydrolase [Actinomycetes bacterium]
MNALDGVITWPATTAAAAVVTADGVVDATGPLTRPLRWASVTKVLTALATWVAVEEGTVALDQAAGPPGSTLRHLLAHASGLAFDSDAVMARPGTRRIYSNRGIEVAADTVAAAAGMSFEAYLREGVLEPLRMTATRLEGSPAAAAVGPVADLARLAVELQRPTLVSADTLAEATSVAFPGLVGVLPGFGRQDPNDWGLGVELRDGKAPHWTPASASPRTFGHFGQAGGFLWVDPDAGVALAALTDRDFDAWAVEAWPALGHHVLAEHARR